MADSKMLDEIAEQLLGLNKKIFHKTGQAPHLVVYMRQDISESLISGIIDRCSSSTRDTELLHDSSIMGFPVFEVGLNCGERHPPYTIVHKLIGE